MNRIDKVREEAATLLNWSRRDVDSFSLATLREWVRPVSKQLTDEITQILSEEAHVLTPVTGRRYGKSAKL